ncbi:MAG: nucleotidyl transferase AbiEii/AbiGii toxin family protein [Gammaproteobacteria bacterium]|nr:nucleotidyl transferase AbiEii/AbiGii toxin family protein [Gammaproteobacteria bacterium]
MRISTNLRLSPHVIEKDYVLGWLLWGIARNPTLGENWLFKGGTCLKKCFFGSYRFSEDLDFTPIGSSIVEEDFLYQILSDIVESVYLETGIEFPSNTRKLEIFTTAQHRRHCQIRIGYQAPVSRRGRNAPRIKIDLTPNERVVLQPVYRSVIHSYSDEPESGISVRTYAFAEIFAEKIRALAERARPRDLYDVIHLYRSKEILPEASMLLDVLRRKCEFRKIKLPDIADLEPQQGILEQNWELMLGSQVPVLTPFATWWIDLASFFDWLYGRVV